ncbi:la protein homolog [Cephus cinctus]|uniref:La protein homolog n=1 Tax=Cephus cinctus TaxID=211228 RepID=A0AAJ7BKB2_CEPCN|nr:la protein homolog [Cephus cinctus]
MENGKDTKEPEAQKDAEPEKVKDDKPADVPAVEEPSAELLTKIKKQVEFYFGDVNMQRDKFLIEQVKLDDGWIPMTVMLNFKLLASMSKDVHVILKALETSDLIEISEDKKKIRRTPKHPIPVFDEEYRKAQEARTVYVKGFPQTGITIEMLKTFFEPYGLIENIVMRKYQDKQKKLQFKGSVFVQFTTVEDAKVFLEKDGVKYEDTELIKKWSADYAIGKAKEKEERKQKKAEKKGEKQENDVNDVAEAEADNASEKDSGLPKGSVLHLSGMSEDSTREHIKERLGELDACIAFVDFKKGDTEGWVRLQGEGAAQPLLDKMEKNQVIINGKEVTCRLLEGEEEAKYLTKAKEEMRNLRQTKMNNRAGKRGGRKGGRGGQRGRKRRGSPGKDEPASKKVTTD